MARRSKTSLNIEGLGTVYIREMTSAEMRELLSQQNPCSPDAARFIITRVLVDAAGRTLLDPAHPDALDNIGAGSMSRIIAAVLHDRRERMKTLASTPRFSLPWKRKRSR